MAETRASESRYCNVETEFDDDMPNLPPSTFTAASISSSIAGQLSRCPLFFCLYIALLWLCSDVVCRVHCCFTLLSAGVYFYSFCLECVRLVYWFLKK
ncbi:UNVERIFIED_CONTAM: hypothetical protein Sradi_0028500 [Sesamum radiatum]|uniref:Transmembrane protein n=1 Tax=Sesamum radiatum TaxID=300843 RepID=A0AAW2WJM2_SESRA